MWLLHFTLSLLREAKHVQGCWGGVIPLPALSPPLSSPLPLFSSSPGAPFAVSHSYPLLSLSLPLPVDLCLFPCTFLPSQRCHFFGWQAQLCPVMDPFEPAGSSFVWHEAALCSSHKSQPCSLPCCQHLDTWTECASIFCKMGDMLWSLFWFVWKVGLPFLWSTIMLNGQ